MQNKIKDKNMQVILIINNRIGIFIYQLEYILDLFKVKNSCCVEVILILKCIVIEFIKSNLRLIYFLYQKYLKQAFKLVFEYKINF